jgi:hypothetical protein
MHALSAVGHCRTHGLLPACFLHAHLIHAHLLLLTGFSWLWFGGRWPAAVRATFCRLACRLACWRAVVGGPAGRWRWRPWTPSSSSGCGQLGGRTGRAAHSPRHASCMSLKVHTSLSGCGRWTWTQGACACTALAFLPGHLTLTWTFPLLSTLLCLEVPTIEALTKKVGRQKQLRVPPATDAMQARDVYA